MHGGDRVWLLSCTDEYGTHLLAAATEAERIADAAAEFVHDDVLEEIRELEEKQSGIVDFNLQYNVRYLRLRT